MSLHPSLVTMAAARDSAGNDNEDEDRMRRLVAKVDMDLDQCAELTYLVDTWWTLGTRRSDDGGLQ